MNEALPTIAVLGASGLIGEGIASQLMREGFPIIPIARRFTRAQKNSFGSSAVESPIVALDTHLLSKMLSTKRADIVVNCIGVLQGRGGSTETVHRVFVERLLAALEAMKRPTLLIHFSMPGSDKDDPTSFSRTKRQAERLIASGPTPFVILRPGIVIAPAAYGGSALMRALAVLPFELSKRETGQSLATTDVSDIVQTIRFTAVRWHDGQRHWNDIWDIMPRQQLTVGEVIDSFRYRLGGPKKSLASPSWLIGLGAKLGDIATWLGWSAPIGTTALQEMRRGVTGNPESWIAATAIQPASLDSVLQRMPASVQEKWFARLYLAKALILPTLVVFWVASGAIALTIAFSAATRILTSHGFAPTLAYAVVAASSIMDISVGLAIAFKRTCRFGLLAGIGVSLFYMAGAAVLTPDMWIEPLGALVKTGPAIVLMLVALALQDNR
jgi:uncharacterized protein YbjT (DUF2867 family)